MRNFTNDRHPLETTNILVALCHTIHYTLHKIDCRREDRSLGEEGAGIEERKAEEEGQTGNDIQ